MSVQIAIVDNASGVNPAELAPAAAALQRQVNEHFGVSQPNGWGESATIRVASPVRPALPSEWVLGLLLKPDLPGALGYHDRTASGRPYMKVFPALSKADGVPWTVTASHEILETLVDPEGNTCSQDPVTGKFWALEVCDCCEADKYLINGVAVSNFATPCYFEPPSSLVGVKLDYMKLIKAPYEIRPGGYNQYWDNGWVMVQNNTQAPRSYRSAVQGRGAMRRRAHKGTPRSKPLSR